LFCWERGLKRVSGSTEPGIAKIRSCMAVYWLIVETVESTILSPA